MKTTTPHKLSEAQQIIITRLQAGASLLHEAQTTGLYRMTYEGKARTVHPATVRSLISIGMLEIDLFGRCGLSTSAPGGDKAA